MGRLIEWLRSWWLADPVIDKLMAERGGHTYRWREPDLAVMDGRADRAWERTKHAEARLRESRAK